MNITILIAGPENTEQACHRLSEILNTELQDYSSLIGSAKQPKLHLALIESGGDSSRAMNNANMQFLSLRGIEVAVFYNPESDKSIVIACDLYTIANPNVAVYYAGAQHNWGSHLKSENMQFIPHINVDQIAADIVSGIKQSEVDRVINHR